MNKITIGADPEFFVCNNDLGEIVSSIGLLGGTKQAPRKCKYGFVQEDNVLGEINVNPSTDPSEFVNNTLNILSEAGDILLQSGHKIAGGVCYHQYPESIASLMLNNDQAKEFGCDPDLNAWTGEDNPDNSEYARENNLRVAGGHIHIGLPHEFRNNPMAGTYLARLCDLFISYPLMVYMPKKMREQEAARRLIYGQAGSYRLKKYGIEYRTVSNIWLWNPELAYFVADAAMKAAYAVVQNRNVERIIHKMEEFNVIQSLSNPNKSDSGLNEPKVDRSIRLDVARFSINIEDHYEDLFNKEFWFSNKSIDYSHAA